MKKMSYRKAVIFLILLIWMMLPADLRAEPCTEHSFRAYIIEHADAEHDGLREYVCKQCGYSYTEVIEKTGHHYGDFRVESEPDCINEGLQYQVCEDCGKEKYQRIPPNGIHHYGAWAVIQEPGCFTEGVRRRNCRQCGVGKEEAIAAIGAHDYEIIEQPASCHQDGEILSRCRRCKEEQRQVIPATGQHQYDETVYPPDCESPGRKIYTCRQCGEHYSELIAALGHKYGEVFPVRAATAESEGLAIRVCQHGLSHIKEVPIPVLKEQPAEPEIAREYSAKEESGVFNQMDIMISGMNITSILVWFWLIKRDRYIINWDKAQW